MRYISGLPSQYKAKNIPRSAITNEHALTNTSASAGLSLVAPITLSSNMTCLSSPSNTTPKTRDDAGVMGDVGDVGEFGEKGEKVEDVDVGVTPFSKVWVKVRAGSGSRRLGGDSGELGLEGRDFALKRVNPDTPPDSFSFSYFCN